MEKREQQLPENQMPGRPSPNETGERPAGFRLPKGRSILKNYIVDAVLVIVAGAILLVRPHGTLEFIYRMFGLILLLMGLIKTALFFFGRNQESKNWTTILIAALQVIAAVWLLADPGFFVGIFPFVAGVMIGYGAVVSMIAAIKLRDLRVPEANLAIILSVVTLVLAVIIILHPPVIAGFIVQVVGLSLIVEGVTMLLTLSRKR